MVKTAQLIAEWAIPLKWEDIPSAVQLIVKEHLADGIGNAMGGRSTTIATAALAAVETYGKSSASTLWNDASEASLPAATFMNAILIHALDFDDTHAGGLVHATAPTLPVAWAIGESLDLSGQEVVLAYTVGLEVICRLGSATPYGFHANGLHATQVCGAIAAAVVASKLMNLTVEQTVNAMGIAGSFSGGLLEFLHTGSSTKQIHPGIAAQGGYISALMAKNGATGPESVLEGEYGIFNSLSARAFDISVVEKDLGITWQAGEITIKPYPACQLSHVSLDAANLAFTSLQGAGYSVVDIESISADVHPDSAKIVCEPMVDKLHPRSAYDAKFSLPWSIAALLIDGGLTSRSFGEESISRPEVLELAKKFHYKDSPTSAVAAASHGEVEIKTFQGSTFKGSLPASFGSPSNRLSAASLRDKFVGQCPVGSKAEEFFENLITIESFAKIKELSTKMTALISE